MGDDCRDLSFAIPAEGHGRRDDVNWGFNFLVSYYFLQMVDVMGKAGTFWLYAGLGLCATVFFLRFVPETRGRSLEEIEQEVTGHSMEEDVREAA